MTSGRRLAVSSSPVKDKFISEALAEVAAILKEILEDAQRATEIVIERSENQVLVNVWAPDFSRTITTIRVPCKDKASVRPKHLRLVK